MTAKIYKFPERKKEESWEQYIEKQTIDRDDLAQRSEARLDERLVKDVSLTAWAVIVLGSVFFTIVGIVIGLTIAPTQ